MIKLYAERETRRQPKLIGEFIGLQHAKNKVLALERQNRWPEGCEAVAVKTNGEAYVLTSDWEPLGNVMEEAS